jgi:hypothetical protein
MREDYKIDAYSCNTATATSGGIANGESPRPWSFQGIATNCSRNSGVHRLYALNIPSLTTVAGFPVLIDGHHADNDPLKYFVGGVAHQRPALTSVNGFIIAAFGSVSPWSLINLNSFS